MRQHKHHHRWRWLLPVRRETGSADIAAAACGAAGRAVVRLGRVKSAAARRRGPRLVSLVVGLALLLLLAASVVQRSAIAQDEDQVSREYRIKAAYLYQFGRYVEWPAKKFSDANAPFVIGVLGQDPILADLEQIARIKKIQDRPIQVRRFLSPADVQECNILYLPSSLSGETQAELIRKWAGHGILLVGDASDFLDRGGAMQFTVEENNIRVAIARKAADREGLRISAKLLQVARIVE